MKHQLSLIFRKFQLKTFVLPILFAAAVTIIACSNMFNDIYDGSRLRTGIFLSNNSGSGCKLFTLDSESTFIEISDKLPTLPLFTNTATILDYDSDGIADIAIGYSSRLLLLHGDGDGSFNINFDDDLVTIFPTEICYHDFNSDGKLDFAITGNQMTIYTRGMTPVSYPAGTNPMPIDKGNLNGDGRIDLYTGSTGSTDNQIFINNSGANVNFTPIQHTTIIDTNDAKLCDINSDGLSDLIITDVNNFIRIYNNTGNANFTEIQNINILNVGSITIGDLDGDGDIDAFIGNSGGVSAGVIINNGSGSFAYKVIFMLSKVVLFDIDFDNDLDVIGYSGTNLYILKNDGRGNFNLHSTTDITPFSPTDIDLFTYHAED